jgi:hypothetical protein
MLTREDVDLILKQDHYYRLNAYQKGRLDALEKAVVTCPH